jgi:hypothetical protein
MQVIYDVSELGYGIDICYIDNESPEDGNTAGSRNVVNTNCISDNGSFDM